jgi:hypothetical protein
MRQWKHPCVVAEEKWTSSDSSKKGGFPDKEPMPPAHRKREKLKSDGKDYQNRQCQKRCRTREKVRSKRINLEGNTHAQEINVSQCPV